MSAEQSEKELSNGISDAELVKKYELSDAGLKEAFGRLLRAMSEGSRHIEIECDGSDPR